MRDISRPNRPVLSGGRDHAQQNIELAKVSQRVCRQFHNRSADGQRSGVQPGVEGGGWAQVQQAEQAYSITSSAPYWSAAI